MVILHKNLYFNRVVWQKNGILMFKPSKSESLHDVSVARIGQTLSITIAFSLYDTGFVSTVPNFYQVSVFQ